MSKLTSVFTSLLLAIGFFGGGGATAMEPASLTEARTSAVAVAKAGHLQEGISRLLALHRSHSEDSFITADLIVLLRLAGQNRQIATLANQVNTNKIPDYARMDLARALRDEKQFEQARTVLAHHTKAFGLPGQILYAMVTLEAGHPKKAIAALPSAHAKGLRAIDLTDMAYIWRRAGYPEKALTLSERALKIKPGMEQGIRERVFALSDMGAEVLALKSAKQYANFFSKPELNRLQATVTAYQIRDAVAQRKMLENHYRYDVRNQPLMHTLTELKNDRTQFKGDPSALLHNRYDMIYTLRELDLMHQAIAEFQSLPIRLTSSGSGELNKIPAYVRIAAADAYLYLHHPHTAAVLYESVIRQHPGTDVKNYIGLYYAYIDGELYQRAESLLKHIHKVTPTWRWEYGKKVPNWQRLDVDQLWAMDAAYRNHEGESERRLRKLSNAAPRNAGLLNALATVERWRGWPEQSMRTTRRAAAYQPVSKDTRINLADNNRDLEHFPLWGQQIHALHHDFPTDTSIQKSLAQWQDRQHFSISSEYTTGKSRGNSNNANPVTGNRDQELQTRLNTPWTNSGWRAFLDQHYLWSSYAEGPLSYNRLGAGVEWRGDRKHFWAMIDNDQLTSNHVGLSAGWSQWLDDQWQYSINGSTYSLDTPLRAKAAGFSGKSIGANLLWRQSESREAYLGLSLLSISDGNKRVDFSTGITQRLFASPHHITSGGIDLFAEHNSQPGGPYFNPSSSESASVRLEHQWITWRRYERSFTQYFKVSAGYGWQSNYGGNPTVDLFYEHKWKFSRTWGLHYGVGWGSNVYDGGREHRLYGLIGFEGVF